MLLFDLFILLQAIIKGNGVIGDMALFNSAVFGILIFQFIDLIWVIDAKNWVSSKYGSFINVYFGIKLFLIVVTYICVYANNFEMTTVLVYLVSGYYVFGAIAIIKGIKG